MAKLRKQHMTIHWHDIIQADSNVPAVDATLKEKATLVGRLGLMMLSVGTGAWRVRNSMNKVSRSLGISCSADIGLVSIECTCIGDNETYTQSLSLPTTGVNTDKLMELEMFMRDFPDLAGEYSVNQFHEVLDHIQKKPANYKAWNLGLASAIACCAFTFLLGGGPVEMICAFFGAGAGNFVRKLMLNRKISLLGNVAVSVATSCIVYVLTILAAQKILDISAVHQAGYICAMLFVIPGFPLITGGIDLAKLDMRSGLERIAYALLIITAATLTGWATAMVFHFQPADFPDLQLPTVTRMLLRRNAGGNRRIYRRFCIWLHRLAGQEVHRIPTYFPDRSGNCHHGTRTVHVPWHLLHGTERCQQRCAVADQGRSDRHCASPWTGGRKTLYG